MSRPAPSPAPGLHDVPTAVELVEAVREFLGAQVLDAVGGTVRFHTRVAMNALGMVQRELEQGGVDVREHVDRLRALGYADDAALAAAIRSGEEDARWTEVKAAVSESVAAKLRVADPGHLVATPLHDTTTEKP